MNASRVAKVLVLVLWATWVQAAHGDGGTLRLSQRQGGLTVSVFTSPTPLRAGWIDVSVLVQDEATRKIRFDLPVTIHLSPMDPTGRKRTRAATEEEATNKLFRAAHFEVPSAGLWRVEVVVSGTGGPIRFECDVEVAAPLPAWLDLSLWIAWPVAAVGLFIVHQWLAGRRSRHHPLTNRSDSAPAAEPSGHASDLPC